MDAYKSIRYAWNFERFLASPPYVWKNEAYNLKGSVSVLFFIMKMN